MMLVFQTTIDPGMLEQLQQQLVDLTNELAGLRSQRVVIDRQLRLSGGNSPEHAQLVAQRQQVTSRIDAVNEQIRNVRSQIEAHQGRPQEASVLVPPTPPAPPAVPGPQWDPDMIVALGGAVIVFIFFPLTLAFARRMWRGKPAAPISPAVNEMPARLDRLEQAVDTIAIEIERISENQRFLTKLMSEKQAPALGAGPIDPIRATDRTPEKDRINK